MMPWVVSALTWGYVGGIAASFSLVAALYVLLWYVGVTIQFTRLAAAIFLIGFTVAWPLAVPITAMGVWLGGIDKSPRMMRF